jgi:hypothetical protein
MNWHVFVTIVATLWFFFCFDQVMALGSRRANAVRPRPLAKRLCGTSQAPRMTSKERSASAPC